MVLTTLVSARTSTSRKPTAAAAAASPPRSHRSLLAVNAGASPAGVGPDLRTPEGRAAAAQQYREQQQHWQQQQQQGFEPFQTPIPPPQHTHHFSAPAPSAGYTYPGSSRVRVWGCTLPTTITCKHTPLGQPGLAGAREEWRVQSCARRLDGKGPRSIGWSFTRVHELVETFRQTPVIAQAQPLHVRSLSAHMHASLRPCPHMHASLRSSPQGHWKGCMEFLCRSDFHGRAG